MCGGVVFVLLFVTALWYVRRRVGGNVRWLLKPIRRPGYAQDQANGTDAEIKETRSYLSTPPRTLTPHESVEFQTRRTPRVSIAGENLTSVSRRLSNISTGSETTTLLQSVASLRRRLDAVRTTTTPPSPTLGLDTSVPPPAVRARALEKEVASLRAQMDQVYMLLQQQRSASSLNDNAQFMQEVMRSMATMQAGIDELRARRDEDNGEETLPCYAP